MDWTEYAAGATDQTNTLTSSESHFSQTNEMEEILPTRPT